MTDAIAEMRAFNRFYTSVSGLLEEGLSRTRLSLPEARLLYEIAVGGHERARDIARSMAVDPAYVSRLHYKLISEGLIVVLPGSGDRRRSRADLTPEGKAAFKALEQATNTAVAALLAPLSERQRSRLVHHMRAVRTLLGDEVGAAPVVIRPHRPGDVSYAIARQSAFYTNHYGWDSSYEALAARIGAQFIEAFDPKRETCLVAEVEGRIAGAVFLVDSGEEVGQLRLLYVEPEVRGLGIGGSLVTELIGFARRAGYRKLRLWTQSILEPARRLYAGAGFELVSSEAHRSFGKDLIGEFWELELNSPGPDR